MAQKDRFRSARFYSPIGIPHRIPDLRAEDQTEPSLGFVVLLHHQRKHVALFLHAAQAQSDASVRRTQKAPEWTHNNMHKIESDAALTHSCTPAGSLPIPCIEG